MVKNQAGMIACRTALLYAAYAGTWILFSDRLLAWLVADPALLTSLQTYKGWAFVAVTALLLYFALQHRVRALEQGEGKERRAVRSFRLLGRCNEAIALAKEEGALISEICRLLVEEGGYRMAWVGFAEGAPGKRVRPAAQAGFAEGYLDAVTITWDEAEIGRGPTGTCIRTGRPVACRDMLQDPAYAGLIGVNMVTVLLYGFDKRQAIVGGSRVPELVLHLGALLGGSPGALLGQGLFRHKTRKFRFQLVFVAILLLQLGAILAYWRFVRS